MSIERVNSNVGQLTPVSSTRKVTDSADAARAKAGSKADARDSAGEKQLEDRVTFSPNARNRAEYGQSPATTRPDGVRAYQETAKSIKRAILAREAQQEDQ